MAYTSHYMLPQYIYKVLVLETSDYKILLTVVYTLHEQGVRHESSKYSYKLQKIKLTSIVNVISY